MASRLTWSDEVYRIFGLQPQEFGATYEAFLDACTRTTARPWTPPTPARSGRTATATRSSTGCPDSTGEVRFVHERCSTAGTRPDRPLRRNGARHHRAQTGRGGAAPVGTPSMERALFDSHRPRSFRRYLRWQWRRSGSPVDNRFLEVAPAPTRALLTPDYTRPLCANRFFRERFGESRGNAVTNTSSSGPSPAKPCAVTVPEDRKAPTIGGMDRPGQLQLSASAAAPARTVDGAPFILELRIDITERKQRRGRRLER